MQKFNRVAKLGHKYTELANKNKIFQQYLVTLTKMTSFHNEYFVKRRLPYICAVAIVLFYNKHEIWWERWLHRSLPFLFWLARNCVIFSACGLEMMLSPGHCCCVERGLWWNVGWGHDLKYKKPTIRRRLKKLGFFANVAVFS